MFTHYSYKSTAAELIALYNSLRRARSYFALYIVKHSPYRKNRTTVSDVNYIFILHHESILRKLRRF